MKIIEIRKVILTTISIFLLSYILVSLAIKYTYAYDYYIFRDINREIDPQDLFLHYPYIIVYGLISLIYSISFYKLHLDKKQKRKVVSKWISLFLILFFSGLILFGINKYYWGIWSHFSFWERCLNILFDYTILFVPFEKIKPVLIWIFSAGIVSYFFTRFNKSEH